MPSPNRFQNRRIKQVLYALQRQWGGRIDIYKRGDGVTDHLTGVKTVVKTVYPVCRAAILPAKVARETAQTISVISANKSFVYGGSWDSSTRLFIVDRKDVPDLDLKSFELDNDSWIVYNNRKYEIKEFQDFEEASAWVITGKAVLGEVPEQIHLLCADNLIRPIQGAALS